MGLGEGTAPLGPPGGPELKGRVWVWASEPRGARQLGRGGQCLGDPNTAPLGRDEGPPHLPRPGSVWLSHPLLPGHTYNIEYRSLSLSIFSPFFLLDSIPLFKEIKLHLFFSQCKWGCGACLPGTSLLGVQRREHGVGVETGWGDGATGHHGTHPDPTRAGSAHRFGRHHRNQAATGSLGTPAPPGQSRWALEAAAGPGHSGSAGAPWALGSSPSPWPGGAGGPQGLGQR